MFCFAVVLCGETSRMLIDINTTEALKPVVGNLCQEKERNNLHVCFFLDSLSHHGVNLVATRKSLYSDMEVVIVLMMVCVCVCILCVCV